MPLARGTRLGSYEVLAPIGAGGMGEVWRARDTKLARDVALKVLPDHLSDDPKSLARFESEAKAVAALSHPHILAIFDFGRADGISYVVTELLEGETLRALLARGPLLARKALDVAAQLADALAAAHEKEIVHRDVKPENVIVTKEGRAKLLDFGLARHDATFRSGDDSRSPTVTRNTDPGAIVGTIAYMSPEQAQGLPAGFRSDQFSLGVVLYEMLTGRRPFHGPSSAETLTAIIRAEHEPLAAAVPAPVRWIVDRLLAKDPAERYAATRDVARDLETCRLHLSEATTGASGAAPPIGPRARGRRMLVSAAAVLVLACMGAGAYWLGMIRGEGEHVPVAAPKLVQLTWESGTETGPSISPDGGSFLYVAGPPRKADIYLRRVGGESATNLTKDFEGSDSSPAFSPDGRWIAFRSERDGGGIFVMGATGESPRRLTDGGFNPKWSPDGREIAYATHSGIGGFSFDASEIWIVTVATGSKRRLYGGNGVSPAWSPSGGRIVFYQRVKKSTLAGGRSVSTIPVSGGVPTVVVAVPGSLGPMPDWSRAGITFVSQAGGVPNLWRVPVDESTGKPTGNAVPIVSSPYSHFPASTPDGRRVLFSFLRNSWRIDRHDFDPQRRTVVGGPTRVLEGPREVRLSGVAPDGRWLAMVLFDAGGRKDILLVRPATGETRRLTDDELEEDYHVWAPDGASLYFGVSNDGPAETWRVRTDGGGRELVVPRRGEDQVVPMWAGADGKTLYVAVGPEHALHNVALDQPLEERRLVPLPTPGAGQHLNVWTGSRDGRWLAGYPMKVPGGANRPLLLYDTEKRTFERLAEFTSYVPCAFLPDARHLVLRRSGQLEVLDRLTKKISPAGSVSPDAIDIGFSADGRSLFTLGGAWESDVWMLDYGKER